MQRLNAALKNISKRRLFWPLAGLAMVLLFNLLFNEGFFTIQMKEGHLYGRLIDIMNRSGAIMILAIGMTLVIATRGIDISVGSICAFSGAVCAAMLGTNRYGIPEHSFFSAIALALGLSVILGLWNGFLVAKLKMQPIIATLILMGAGRGIAQLISGGTVITVYYKPFTYLALYLPGVIFPTSLLIAAVVLIATLLVIKKTSLGLFIQSAGINPVASRFSGIKVNKLILFVYAFSGLCAGISGLLLASMIRAADSNNAGMNYELFAILAVALGGNSLNGGKFSIMASIIGAIIIQSITTTMYAFGLRPEILPFVQGVVVLLICIVQSSGFLYYVSKIFSIRKREVQYGQIEAK